MNNLAHTYTQYAFGLQLLMSDELSHPQYSKFDFLKNVK